MLTALDPGDALAGDARQVWLDALYGPGSLAVLTALDPGDALEGDAQQVWLDEPYVDASPGRLSHLHLAVQASTRAQVDAFHAAGLAAGGRDNGPPGLRSDHPRYDAAFLLDPDGNNIEAVCDAPVRHSAAVIEVERLPPDEEAP